MVADQKLFYVDKCMAWVITLFYGFVDCQSKFKIISSRKNVEWIIWTKSDGKIIGC